MDSVEWRDHVVSDPSVLGGKPILKGTPSSAQFVLELLAGGRDRQPLAEDHPSLTEKHLRAVPVYAAETFREEPFYLLPPLKTPA